MILKQELIDNLSSSIFLIGLRYDLGIQGWKKPGFF